MWNPLMTDLKENCYNNVIIKYHENEDVASTHEDHFYTLKKRTRSNSNIEWKVVVVLPTVFSAHTGLQTQACC